MSGKELIEKYKSIEFKVTRNSMGCNENWYYNIYAIYNTFSEEEIMKMSEREIDLLIKLADKMSEAFY